jgi:hypothetical protein
MKRRLLATGLGAGALFALSVPAALATSNQQVKLRSAARYPAATGTAQYQAQPGQREFQVEVGHLRSLAGQRVSVFVNGARIGKARVTAAGRAELVRNSEIGQRVPAIRSGTHVSVRTGSGALLVTGAF